MEKLGDKIYRLRKSKGLSQEELAESLNVSRQSVSKWETDRSVPDSDNITAMCAFFGVSLDGFMGSAEPALAAKSAQDGAQADEKTANRQMWKRIVFSAFLWFFAAVGAGTFVSFLITAIAVGDAQFKTVVIPILCAAYAVLFAVVFAAVAVFYKKFKNPRMR